MLNKASVSFIQNPCLPSLVAMLSPPHYVFIVCAEELLDIYPRDGMVPIKSSNNFLAPLESFSSQLLHCHVFSPTFGEGTSLSTFYARLKIH